MKTKKNSGTKRIDGELIELLEQIENENDVNQRQASRIVARQLKELKKEGKLIRREIKF